MSKLNVLISGGGVAGLCLAWWLHRRNLTSKITVIERAPEPRISGQAVDIRNAAVNVIKQMGLEESIKAKTTTEEGIEFVYADGKTKASFGTTGEDGAQSLTSEYEILRGDLAKIFYERTERLDGIEYVYDESISEIQEVKDGRIQVAFKNRLPQAEYDLVIGADGMISQTRRIVFGKGPEDKDYLHPLGQYCAFFTISRIGSDTKWAQWYVAPGGHAVVTRPDQYGETRAYLAVTDSNLSRFDEIKKAMKQNSEVQKAWLEKEFEGAGWQTARVVEGMKTAPDFYMTEIAQVKMDQFVTGRVALLGDAGYCPTPISGMVGILFPSVLKYYHHLLLGRELV